MIGKCTANILEARSRTQAVPAYRTSLAFLADYAWTRMLTVLLLMALCSCSILSQYGRYPGIELLASRGHPPATSLIGSRTNSQTLLVNEVEIGFGMGVSSKVVIWNIHSGDRREVAETRGEVIAAQTWSPDGKEVVLDIPRSTQGFESYSGLWIRHIQDGSLEFLADRGRALWSPDGKLIALLQDPDATEGARIRFISAVEKRDEPSLMFQPDPSLRFLGGDWSPDGTQLVISARYPGASIPWSLFLYNIRTGQISRITDKGENISPAWSPAGPIIAYIERTQGSASDALHVRNLQSGCDVVLPHIDSADSLAWSPDGHEITILGPDGIYRVDIGRLLGRDVATDLCTSQ